MINCDNRMQIYNARRNIELQINKQVCAYRQKLREESQVEFDLLQSLCLKFDKTNGGSGEHDWKHNGYNINHEYEYFMCIWCGAHRTEKLA